MNPLIASLTVVKTMTGHLETALDKYLADESIPVLERWDVFKTAIESGVYRKEQCWVLDFDFMKEQCWEWYDDFYIDRYKTVNLLKFVDIQVADSCEEMLEEEYEAFILKVREEVLKCGFTHFTLDW